MKLNLLDYFNFGALKKSEMSEDAKKEGEPFHFSKLSGGPKGLGDPDDRSLRKVEKNTLIPERMRTKARRELCEEFNLAFANCCRENGGMMVFKCQTETENLKKCIKQYFFDPEFEKQVTEEYLEERSEYRRTGIAKKYRDNYERILKLRAAVFQKREEDERAKVNK